MIKERGVGRMREEDLKIHCRHIQCAVHVANTRTRVQNTAMLGAEGIAMETKRGERPAECVGSQKKEVRRSSDQRFRRMGTAEILMAAG